MSVATQELEQKRPSSAPESQTDLTETRGQRRTLSSSTLALPAATIFALVVHSFASKGQGAAEVQTYFWFLGIVLGLEIIAIAGQFVIEALRKWMNQMFPIFAAAVVMLTIWEIITLGLHW